MPKWSLLGRLRPVRRRHRPRFGLITPRFAKNRFGDKPTLTVQPDFDAGRFELTESSASVERRDHVQAIRGLIKSSQA